MAKKKNVVKGLVKSILKKKPTSDSSRCCRGPNNKGKESKVIKLIKIAKKNNKEAKKVKKKKVVVKNIKKKKALKK